MYPIVTRIQSIALVFCVGTGLCHGLTENAHGGETKAAFPIAFPDGVIDADLRAAFVSSPKGGIQAIRLEDGKVLWTNDEVTAQPWLTAGQRLIARGERIIV